MRCLVAVFLVLQVCYTGVIGADVQVNQDCSGSGSTCVPADTNVCDPKADTANTCKTKVGKNCLAVTDCIKNAVCTVGAPCLCNTHFTPSADNTTCVADGTVINGVCKSDGTCTVGTCDKNAVGGPKCKNKEDENCVAVGSCIKNAECTGANSKCTCNTGFTASTDKTACGPSDGTVNGACKPSDSCDGASLTCDKNADGGAKCKNKVGEPCAAKGNCIKNADCPAVNQPCNCTAGYNVNTDKTVCESAGAASSASMLLLAALFVTSRFL